MKTTLDLQDAPALGRSLRAIDPKLLKDPSPGRKSQWWKGDERYLDVFVETDKKGIAWIQVTVRCRAVTWDRDKKTMRTGTTNEMTLGEPYPGSKTITNDKKNDDGVIAFALAMLDANPGLHEVAATLRT